MSKDLLKEIAADLAAVQKKAVKKLEGTDYVALGTTVSYNLDKIINQLSHLGGFTVGSGAVKEEFGPITSFMGDKLPGREKVTAEQVTPTMTEKERFAEKANAYYSVFTQIDPAKVLIDAKAPGQEQILRAVAKKAKVKDYAKAELTVEFIAAITQGINSQAADTERKREFEANLLKQQGGAKAPAAPVDGVPGAEVLPDGAGIVPVSTDEFSEE